MFTLSQILGGLTLAEAEAELLEFVQEQGITTTNWGPGSPELTMLKTKALIYKNLCNRIAQQAKNMLNDESEGDALTILSQNVFDNERGEALKTEGMFVITATNPLVLPVSFAQNELEVTDGTWKFSNKEPFTLSVLNNGQPFLFEAQAPGGPYNLPNNTTLTSLFTQINLGITNPPFENTTTWITRPGQCREEDVALRNRNKLKWAELQVGDFTVDRVKSIVFRAVPQITNLFVDDKNPRGAFTVDVYLAQSLTTSTEAQNLIVQQKFDETFFGNKAAATLVSASSATETQFNRPIKIFYNNAFNETFVKQNVFERATEWVADQSVGGRAYTSSITGSISVLNLLNDLRGSEGVVKVSGSADDIFLLKNEKLVPPLSGSSFNWGSVITFEPATIGSSVII